MSNESFESKARKLSNFEKAKRQIPNKYFYCPKCKKVPRIKMKLGEIINVKCNCFDKKEHITDDDSDPKSMDELTSYYSYDISLSRFIKELDNTYESPKCEDDNHSGNSKVNKFCTFCQNFYCEKCLDIHNKNYNEHLLIKSNGIKLNSTCENPLCKEKGKIRYYCNICSQHLCENCKNEHLPTHFSSLIDVTKMALDDEKLKRIMNDFDKLNGTNEYDYKNYLHYLEIIEDRLQNCRKLLNEKLQNDKKVIKFYQSLIANYNDFKDNSEILSLNYHITNNLIINYGCFKQNYKYSQKLIEGRLDSQVRSFCLKSYFESSILAAEYLITDSSEEDAYRIFGHEFNELNDDNCIMYINGKECPFTKEFPDRNLNHHTIQILMKEGKYIDNMKGMFDNCKSLILLDLSNFETSNVTNMKEMFNECCALSNLNLKGINTNNVTDMSYMFNCCWDLASFNSSTFNTSSVTNMSYMFAHCFSLTSLNVADFDTNNVTNMNYMFYDCPKLSPEIKAKFE